MELAEQIHHRFAVLRAEVAGRLGGEKDRRVASDRARDRDAVLALARRHVAIRERELDVLEDREVADGLECLEDEADLPVADASALHRCQRRDLVPVEQVVAVARRVEQSEDREQRRLAAARRAADRHVLTLVDVEVDVLQYVRLHLVGQEDLLGADPRHGRREAESVQSRGVASRDRPRSASPTRIAASASVSIGMLPIA